MSDQFNELRGHKLTNQIFKSNLVAYNIKLRVTLSQRDKSVIAVTFTWISQRPKRTVCMKMIGVFFLQQNMNQSYFLQYRKPRNVDVLVSMTGIQRQGETYNKQSKTILKPYWFLLAFFVMKSSKFIVKRNTTKTFVFNFQVLTC